MLPVDMIEWTSHCLHVPPHKQAKMEEERRAAAAVREAAKTAAHAVTQQREAARQQHADLLSSRINARLKEAAQRRCAEGYVLCWLLVDV